MKNILRLYKRFLAAFGVLAVLLAIPLTVYLSGQRQEIRQHASGNTGQLLCVPVGGITAKYNSDSIQVTNISNGPVTLKAQQNLCDYTGQGSPLPNGTECKNFVSVQTDTLAQGESKTYRVNVPACKYGQLDIYEGSPPSFVASPDGCYTDTNNTYWSGGLAFTLKANTTGYPNNCPVNTPTPTSASGATPTPTGITSTPAVTNTPVPSPTETPFPTPTPPASGVALSFTLNLPGITNGTLQHRLRNLIVELYDSSGNKIGPLNVPSALNFNGGKFTGTISLYAFSTPVNAGIYTIKTASDRYLKRQIVGFTSIPAATTTLQTLTVPEATLVLGDVNMDNKIDILDYNGLIACFGDKKNTASCAYKQNSDLDDNGIVDEIDFNALIRGMVIQQGD